MVVFRSAFLNFTSGFPSSLRNSSSICFLGLHLSRNSLNWLKHLKNKTRKITTRNTHVRSFTTNTLDTNSTKNDEGATYVLRSNELEGKNLGLFSMVMAHAHCSTSIQPYKVLFIFSMSLEKSTLRY